MRESGIGSAFAQLVTPGALERLAGFVADIWRPRPPRVSVWVHYDDDELETGSEGLENPVDPLEELDRVEIVQVVRRDDIANVGVDYRGLELDTAIALMFRGAVQLLLEELIEFDEGEEGEDEED